VVTVDLGAVPAGNSVPLAGAAGNVTSVYVSRWPGGDGFLKLGPAGDEIPIDESLSWQHDPCGAPPERDGVFLRLPGALGGTAVFLIFYGGGSASIGA
jgi:hypothetical protein